MFERCLLTDRDVEQLADAVLTVLERVGALYQNDEILDAVEAAGARVDRSRQVATFPRPLVEEFVRTLRAEAPPEQPGPRPFTAPAPGRLFHQLSQYYYDSRKRERRIGNRADYAEILKVGDRVHPEQGVGHCLLLSDVPAPVEPLEATLLQFQTVRRPLGAYVQDLRQVPYLEEMEKVSGVSGLVWLANIGFSSPLRLGRDIAERWIAALRRGRPVDLYVMTASGAGTPVTTAGCVVVAAAELIANWMAGRALRPGAPLNACVWLSTLDMRSGEGSYLAFDALQRGFAVREFLRRFVGKDVSIGDGEYTPAKTPGLYAALEKAYRAMVVSAFTGVPQGVGMGHLDGGLAISPVQLLLDREWADALRHLAGPIAVTPESIGLDAIVAVGHAEETSYLRTEHTARNFRSALWLPDLLERGGWTGVESEERVLARAQERVDALLAAYEPPAVDEGMLAQLRRIVDRARRELA